MGLIRERDELRMGFFGLCSFQIVMSVHLTGRAPGRVQEISIGHGDLIIIKLLVLAKS